MSKAFLYGKPCEVLEYRAEGFVRVRMLQSGNVFEVPSSLVKVQEDK